MRCRILALLLFGWGRLLVAQPVNDDCAGLIDLGEAPVCPSDTFTNVGATQSAVFSDPDFDIPACFNSGVVSRDVWFSFTVPADGSVLDFSVAISGTGMAGGIVQPQLAVYRGDCTLDGLQELACATSDVGSESVQIHLLGLTPGVTYFLRVDDYSASATPNWGDFTLCIGEYVPAIQMGEVSWVESCTGTLFDSGGPDGDYGNAEDLTLTICPQEVPACISLLFESYAIEDGFDALEIFAGPDLSSPQVYVLDGTGSDFELSVNSSCLTLRFTSDGSVTEAGFEMTWTCAPAACDVPPIVSCAEPIAVPALPFAMSGLTTCLAGNSVADGPCNEGNFLAGEDIVFTYVSPGQECISVQLSGTLEATGVGVYAACPGAAVSCIAQSGGGFGQADPHVGSAFLEAPGTYFIVVDNAQQCTPFDILIEQADCPVVFPSAAECAQAISLNGCGDLPAVITVSPGQGDPDFVDPEVNLGCWGTFFPLNYTFFWFEAQADGQFGFTMQAEDPAEASDLDFQIWGPVPDIASACDYARTHVPVRSSYAAGADPTGLADVHPLTGLPVEDECEDAGGDDFVATLPVQQGEVYLVLVNDWGDNIASGAVAIDFSATTPGVLDAEPVLFSVGPDTVVCPGQQVQLSASGGVYYEWMPADGLSCVYCPEPVAVVEATTTYQVAVHSLCRADTLPVTVHVLSADAGPDRTVCLGEELQLVAGVDAAGLVYAWQGPPNTMSCTDCPDPVVVATQAGTFTYGVTVVGPTCTSTDQMLLTVLPQPAPSFELTADTAICMGDSIALSAAVAPDVVLSWSSVPAGFVSTEPQPVVSPAVSTTYYVTAANGLCPLPAADSVRVEVIALPQVQVGPDTMVCEGVPVALSALVPEPDVAYAWSPQGSLVDPADPLAVALPPPGITHYVLTAQRGTCAVRDTIVVEVIPIQVRINAPDTLRHCRGDTLSLSANVSPAQATLQWLFSPAHQLLDTTATTALLLPQAGGWYFAKAQTEVCVRVDSVFVGVDSLPPSAAIVLPADTLICRGETVVLHSPLYDPAQFMQIEFQWLPLAGQQSPDTLYHLVVQPDTTTRYYRIARNGFCMDTAVARVAVQPLVAVEVQPAAPELCPGESIQLTVTTSEPAALTWTPAASLSCVDCPEPVATPTQTTTYRVTAEHNGCSNTSETTVVVLPRPRYALPAAPVLCLGDQVVLNLAPDTAFQHQWTASNGAFASTVPAPVVQPLVTTTYYLEISYPGCAPVHDSVTVFIADDAVVDAGPDRHICRGEVVLLHATSNLPEGQYLWLPDSLFGVEIAVMPLVSTSYTVQLHTPCGVVEDSVWVQLISPFSLDSVVAVPDTVFEGQAFELHGYTTPEVLAGPEYTWLDAQSQVLGLTTVPVLQLVAPEIETDILQLVYTLLVNDQYGCSAEVKVPVWVREAKIEVPNLFTPNGDGINDHFAPIYPEAIEITRFRIYNRWGRLVFEHPVPIWDGTIDGRPAPADVYVWRLNYRFNGREEVLSGEVTLLR